MNNLFEDIDISLIQEEVVSISDLKNEVEKQLNDSFILKEGIVFEDDVWVTQNENTKTYNYVYWEDLNDLKRLRFITQDDINILKCWVADDLIDGTVKVKLKIDALIDFILKTRNFDKDIIEDRAKGDVVLTYINRLEGRKRRDSVESIKEYLIYLEDKDLITDEHYTVLEMLTDISFESKKDKCRKLPSEYDILTFDYYLKYFFNDENIEDEMKEMFYPILIWWKVTNVIPIRPVEICTKLKRDCLEEDNGKYYIHIDRAKVNTGKNKNRKKRSRIPILSKLPISKDIYDLMKGYIELTEWDTDTKTFFSYRALKKSRAKYSNYSENLKHKINEDYFTNSILSGLVDKFYDMVIKDIYSVEIVTEQKNKELQSIYGSRVLDKMDVGDTRHIAFTSLLLQGVSHIEIAMLGGHTSLRAQDHYQGHTIFYADSEIINLVTQRNMVHPNMDSTLKEIVFSKPETPPRDLKGCMPTEDGVGYCLIDLDSELIDCTGGDCIRCKHWWCEPTNENYIILEDYLKDNAINPLECKIQHDEAYLKNLLANKKTVSIDGLLDLDREYEDEVSRVVKRLNRNITINKYNIKSLSETGDAMDGLRKMIGGNELWLELKEQ